ncbi:MAG: hypothetical protein ABIN67_12935 [Ferruginibacter sp.]
MLQNRVDPIGNIIKTKARGCWTGNRGVLHNEHQQIVRPYKLKAWLTCKLEFKGWKRKVMSPNRWTELFFLDEATAFAAGHRPCCECRRNDFNRFKSFWVLGNPKHNYDEKTSVKKIDSVLHEERMDNKRSKVTFEEDIDDIPNGSFVLINNSPHLFFNRQVFLWTPFGYEKGIQLPDTNKLTVLTPRSVVNTFRAGYLPQTADLPAAL